jgi:hypothetical protein
MFLIIGAERASADAFSNTLSENAKYMRHDDCHTHDTLESQYY